MTRKLNSAAFIVFLFTIMLAFTMMTIGCSDPNDIINNGTKPGENPTGDGEGGDDNLPPETVGIEGKWVNQGASTFTLLEFTSTQLIISGKEEAVTYYTSETGKKIEIGTSTSTFDQTFCDSYNITAGVLTFTGGESATLYPSANFYRVNVLTAGQWKDGRITNNSKGQIWYSFNVTEGTAYRMWWNDDGSSTSGNGLKTLDIYVAAYYSTGTSIFTNTDTAWGTAKSFTPDASQASTVYVKVTPYSSGNTGTFGIAFTTGGTGAVTERPAVSFNPPSPIPLTADQWKDGEITSDSNGEVWYSFNVTAGSVTAPAIYNIWWNESGSNGNNTKTLNVSVRGFYNDGTSAFSTSSSAWTTQQVLNSSKSGTVYLKVTPGTSGQTGTFGIVYNTGLGSTRPPTVFNPLSTALTEDQWEDGEIISGSDGQVWYSLNVTADIPYYIWWNESNSNYGNRLKTLSIKVSALDSTGTAISGFSETDNAWGTGKSFTPTADGKVYLRVLPDYSGYTGTFGLVYSTTNTRPPIIITPPVTPIPLNLDTWDDGAIVISNGEVWYSFTANSGTTYRVWWNDSYEGSIGSDGTSKSLNVKVGGWNTDGDDVFYDVNSGWGTAQTITPTASGTVYLRVMSYNSGDTGTFGIAYSETTTRPTVYLDIPNAIPLVADEAKSGAIATPGTDAWYTFDVVAGTTYRLWYNGGSNNGDGTKTLLSERATIYYRDSTGVTGWNTGTGWTSPFSFTPNAGNAGTVYVRIYSTSSTGTGTYSVIYSDTATSRPLVPIEPPVTPIPLTIDTWADGQITSGSGGSAWYTFTAATATTHYLWWDDHDNGNGQKTLDVKVSAYYADGTALFSDKDAAWDTPQSFTVDANRAGSVVYIKVLPFGSGGGTGTFGIVYRTTNTRPVVPFNPPSATSLTANVWTNGNIAVAEGQQWFSFNATAATHYIHVVPDTAVGMYVLVCDSNGVTIGTESSLAAYSSGGYVTSTSLTPGQNYYIRIRYQYANITGPFKITFNSSNLPPIELPSSAIALTAGEWTSGNIATSNGVQWFKFTATAATQYVHSTFGTLSSLYVEIYDSNGIPVGNKEELLATTRSVNRTLTVNQDYYIRVYTSSGGTGTYYLILGTLSTVPSFTPPNATPLTAADTWASGNIATAGGQEWFTFTATTSTTNGQYIHIAFGTLNDLYVQVHDSTGGIVSNNKTNISSYFTYASRTLTVGQTYHILVWPYRSSGSGSSGNYQIAFNTSSTAPAP